MSAKKRRIKRKLAQLVRMDEDMFKHWWLNFESAHHIIAAMKTRGRWLAERGYQNRAVSTMFAARRRRGQSTRELSA